MSVQPEMIPTSQQQFALWTDGPVPKAGPLPANERIRDDLWAITVPFPNPFILYTLSYLIIDSEGRPHIIDPGFDSDANWSEFRSGLSAIGVSETDVGTLTVTHAHPDHLGLAERFAEVSGAPIVIHGRELAGAEDGIVSAERWGTNILDDWGVPSDRRSEFVTNTAMAPLLTASHGDVLVDDGFRLDIPGWNLNVIHTPGHTAGHIVLYEPDRQLLFTGDHVLPNMHPGLGLGAITAANPLADYLDSLGRMRELGDGVEVLPGHGYRFRGLGARVDEMAEHRNRRSREVVEVLEGSPDASTWEVASQLTWTAGWENLKAMDLASALSQASMHHRHVRGRS